MNQHFKDALLKLYFDASAYYYIQGRRMDHKKIIAFGAWGEAEEDYFLFIYRDAFEKTIRYGAVLFLYQPYDLKQPIQVTYWDSGTGLERRNIYTRAAAYFLKNQCQDTMALEGEVKKFHRRMQKIIAAHHQEENQRKEKYTHFNFDLQDQEFRVNEIKLRQSQNNPTPAVIKKLKLLKPGDNKVESAKEASARLGLSLVMSKGEYEYRKTRFQPVIVPLKRDGTYGAPKPAVRSQVEKYHFDRVPELLNEFMGHLHELSVQKKKDPTRIDTISQVYFERLADFFLHLPEELTFYQFDSHDSPFYPLKTIKFKKLEVQFAPLADQERLRIFLILTGDHDRVFNMRRDYQVITRPKDQVYLFFTITDGQSYFAIPGETENYDAFFRFLDETREFSVDDFQAVRDALQHVASDSLVIHPEPLQLYNLKFHPIPILKILKKDSFTGEPERIEMEFDYHSGVKKFLEKNSDIQLVNVEKDSDFETMCLFLLKGDSRLNMEIERDPWTSRPSGYYFTFREGDDIDWLMESSGQYLDKGFKVYSARQKKYIGKTGSRVRLTINPGVNWLEFRPLLENSSSGETFEIDTIDFENSTIIDKRGTLHVINKEDIEQLTRLNRYAQHRGLVYRVPSENYFLINALYDWRVEEVPQLQDKLAYAQELQNFKKISNYKLSKNFKGKLRSYQRAGFKWLRFLREYRLGGCLADDMGLGKTVQTLALLQTLKDEDQLKTSLLVVPVSAVPNWELEIGKFTPRLTYYRHLGSNREKDVAIWENHDLVITSYATLRNDIEIFKDFPFDYVVLDESQAIKNVSSQVTKAVKILRSNYRLALSGTPIENTSMELWSLVDFLMPGFLGNQQWFRSEWALPVEKYKDEEKTGMLKQMIYPFILRRKKEEVEKELPEKIQLVETLKMDEEQVNLYVETAAYYSEVLTKSIDEKGLEKSSIKILEGMLRLRQICLFPQLVDPKYQSVPSVKFLHFTEMLEDIIAEGHKVLIFSQFVKVLGIIKKFLDKKTLKYCYIDGSLDAGTRGKMIKAFQEDKKIRVFLLSLKAGGVAINLTAADYVIIFDPWWNPAVEAQAIDRSHRIGQTKKVFVYRLVVKDTIEEKMLALQEQKRELVDKLITSESKTFKNLNKEAILSLFKL